MTMKLYLLVNLFWGQNEIFSCKYGLSKKYFPSSLPSSKLTISDLISIYKHDAIDIADPNSMQDACHINFVIDLAHLGVSVAQWSGH